MEWIQPPRRNTGFLQDGAGLADHIAVALLIALLIAVLGILLQWWLRRDRRPWIVIDGSNVMHWIGEVPQIDTLARVIGAVEGAGFRPLVWFDANAGYKLRGRYMNETTLALSLDLSDTQVRIAPKGTRPIRCCCRMRGG